MLLLRILSRISAGYLMEVMDAVDSESQETKPDSP